MAIDLQDKIIDAHIHVWTDDTDSYPLAPGVKKSDLWRPRHTVDDHAVYSSVFGKVRMNLVQMIWYGFDHQYIIDLIAGAPGRFVGTGIISLDDPDPGKTMVDLSHKGCFAFRASPSELDHPDFEKIFTTGADHGLALSFNMGVDLLPTMDRMCQRFPATPVILDHVCHVGIAKADYQKEDLNALLRFAKHEKVMVKIGPLQGLCSRLAPYLDVLPLIQHVVEAYGAHRCMWESDSGGPTWMPEPSTDFPAAIELISDHADFLSDLDKQHILYKTAEDFFFNR